jgi:hypothetical protein
MRYKLSCAKRQPGIQVFNSREFSIAADNNGVVTVSTDLKCRVWSAKNAPQQLLVFSRQQSKLAKDHALVVKSDDLMVIELKTPNGKEYVVSTSTTKEIDNE